MWNWIDQHKGKKFSTKKEAKNNQIIVFISKNVSFLNCCLCMILNYWLEVIPNL